MQKSLEKTDVLVTPDLIYLAHQQGMSGTKALLAASSETKASQALAALYGGEEAAEKIILGNMDKITKDGIVKQGKDPKDISAKDFVSYWKNKYTSKVIK